MFLNILILHTKLYFSATRKINLDFFFANPSKGGVSFLLFHGGFHIMVNCWFGLVVWGSNRGYTQVTIPFIFGNSRNPNQQINHWLTITLPETNIAPENGWLEY